MQKDTLLWIYCLESWFISKLGSIACVVFFTLKTFKQCVMIVVFSKNEIHTLANTIVVVDPTCVNLKTTLNPPNL